MLDSSLRHRRLAIAGHILHTKARLARIDSVRTEPGGCVGCSDLPSAAFFEAFAASTKNKPHLLNLPKEPIRQRRKKTFIEIPPSS